MPTGAAALKKQMENFPWDKWGEKFQGDYQPLYRDLIVLGGDFGAADGSEDFDLSDPFTSEFMTDYIGERIVSLQDTTKSRVIDIIRNRFDAGETQTPFEVGTAILDDVRETFDGYERYRADRIARTETGIGFNHGTVLGTMQAGFEQVDVSDGDDDDECAEADGDVWDVDEALANPLEHPNCVRAFAPHVPDDEDE